MGIKRIISGFFNRSLPVFVLVMAALHIEAQDISFRHYNSENGLPKNSVNKILQDNQGFIWIATTDGLSRYDGANFKTYRHEPGNPNSINHSNVISLHEDPVGNLWVGSRKGVNKFDPKTQQFTSFLSNLNPATKAFPYIMAIESDVHGNIWCGSYYGLYRIYKDQEAYKIDHFLHDPEDSTSITDNVVWDILEDQSLNLWIGTTNGMDRVLFDNASGTISFEHFMHNPENENSLSSNQVWEIDEDRWGNLWIGTRNGISKFNPETGKFRRFVHDPENPASLSHNYIFGVLVDRYNRLWAGTYNGGLNLADLSENSTELHFHRFMHQPENPAGIISNDVKDIYFDRSDILWIGTYGGLDKIDPNENNFNLVQTSIKDPASLSSNYVQAVLEDSFGNLWIGTREGGLNFLSAKKTDNKLTGYQHIFSGENDDDLPHNDVYCLFEDSKNRLWVGTYGGVGILQLKEQINDFRFLQVKNYNFTKKALTHNYVFDIAEDEEGEFWIATYGGLTRLTEISEGVFKSTFYESDINDPTTIINSDSYTLCVDANDDLWIGTFMGLCVFKKENGERKFLNFLDDEDAPTSLKADEIFVLYRDSRDFIWAGTIDGLTRISIDESQIISFKQFTAQNSPVSGAVYGIVEDTGGKLWLSGNNGLTVFNPENSANPDEDDSDSFKNYNVSDGLQGNEFVQRAAFINRNNELYFGGKNGFNFFNPENLITNPHFPQVVLTDFQLDYQSVDPGSTDFSGDSPLQKSISHTSFIELRHWQNNLSIEFAALNFTLSDKNKFKYQLVGFDPDWVHSGHKNLATYTNLDPGTYTFNVMAANNDGLWNPEPTSLQIVVNPPIWQTWYAYLFYLLLLATLIYFYNRYRVGKHKMEMETQLKIERAKVNEREEIRRKNAADFHDELGHSITRITLFTELAKREDEPGPGLRQYLDKVNENVKYLSGGIRDFIWALDPGKDTMHEVLMRLQEFGDKLFEFTEVKFETTGFSDKFNEVHLEADTRRHILLIFKEAMNNSLKYAACNTVGLSAEMDQNGVYICLTDDGTGFDPETVKRGNGLKNMQQRAEKTGSTIEFKRNKPSGSIVRLSISKKPDEYLK